MLGYIIEHSDNKTRDLVDTAEIQSKKKAKDGAKYIPVLEHIKSIYTNTNSKGVLNSSFKQVQENGRLTAAKGLSGQMISRPIRHAVFEGFYRDIDLDNCHPTILLQYCQKNSIPCETLKEMVEYRDEMIQSVISRNPHMCRDDVKVAILSLLNGGRNAYNNIPNKTPALRSFATEVKSIIAEICKLNPDIFLRVKQKRIKDKKKYNYDGATMCIILQTIENRMLECMELVFSQYTPITETIPVHDGMMVPDILDDETFFDALRQCEEMIATRCGYKVHMSEKKMDSHKKFKLPDQDILDEYTDLIFENKCIQSLSHTTLPEHDIFDFITTL